VTLRPYERALCFYLPATVLLVAFAAVCVQAGTPWPWTSVVHEDGRHTLIETIFYFEHATRELLLDAVLAMAVAGAMRCFFPPTPKQGNPHAARARRRLALWTLAALALILGGTAYVDGVRVILDNLSQYHTRPGAAFAWGAHWRYHSIERFAEILLVFCVAGLVWLRDGRPAAGDGLRDTRLYVASLAAFAGATLVFLPSTEPFRDPMFLGHQIRELFTHTLVTLPLAFGTCLVLARRYSTAKPGVHADPPVWAIYVAGFAALACYAYLLVASLRLKAQTLGQKSSLAELLFPHFFEHSLGYLFVATLAGLLYLWPGSNADAPAEIA
jgi:hypothetical protein